jgi:16S rRNA (guanine966-N2)-methyltransferase
VRIVGGSLSGRTFAGPKGEKTRPTAERVREAVFSALEARGAIDGQRVLDLYAGTGALAFEALSRGASEALSVEVDPRNVAAIERDARALGLTTHRASTLDVSRKGAIERIEGRFGLVMADPPWADLARAADVLAALVARGRLSPGGHLVLVHSARDRHPTIDPLAIEAEYKYGDTAVVLYAAPDGAAGDGDGGIPLEAGAT